MSAKKKATKSDVGIETGIDSVQKVERIREIVFGAQMRDYDQRFNNVTRDYARLQQEMANANKQILSQIKQLGDQLHELNERLDAKIGNQSQQLIARIEEVDNRQTAQLRNLDTRVNEELHRHEAELAQQVQKLTTSATEQFERMQQSLHMTSEDIRSELRENAEHLSNVKTDRMTLGQLLIEMGNDLQKGDSDSVFSKLLNELSGDLEFSAEADSPDVTELLDDLDVQDDRE